MLERVFFVFLLLLSASFSAYSDTVDFAEKEKNTYQLNSFNDTLVIKKSKGYESKGKILLITSPVEFVEISKGDKVIAVQNRGGRNFGEEYSDPYFFFPIDSTWDNIKVRPTGSYVVSVELVSSDLVRRKILLRNVFTSLFIGIMLSMFLYNLILYILLGDITYVYYLSYLLFIAIAQISLLNFDYYLFSSYPIIYKNIFHVSSGLAGVFAILFASVFLKVSTAYPRILWIFRTLVIIYSLVVVLMFLGLKDYAHILVQVGGLSAFIIIGFSFHIAKKGVRDGYFIAISYLMMVLGGGLLSLRDFGLIGDSTLTQFTLPIGVALQVILISIALANQITTLRKAYKKANQKAVDETKKNENLVKDQNVILEKLVRVRTAELETTLANLKEAQSQLVQSEKMASLGVLTAGIAHEINNPINFVTANVVPLRENIGDISSLISEYRCIDKSNLESELARLKKVEQDMDLEYVVKETQELIDGIEEGARRTHVIVDGLKTFSRGDSGADALSDINKGIKSTLSVLKSRLNGVELVTDLGESLPMVNCHIGKINQVILNIVNNALDALEEKYGPNSKDSIIEIKTESIDGVFKISITDNANGMSAEVKGHILEPFYTTKAVGKGTGLGLSISYSIIEEHGGDLELISKIGEGTTFTVNLPIGEEA